MLIIPLKRHLSYKDGCLLKQKKSMNNNIFLLKIDKFYFKINISLPVRCFV